jgi:COMPASS component BRE2
MARANVGVREGRWYWECKILSGIRPANLSASSASGQDDGGHVRVGWARREASLDTPVGFDAYSYGFRDVSGQKVHMSRPKDFMPDNESFHEGDVIGLEINLPSLNLHRKVVEGIYNKAVDISDDLDTSALAESSNIIRDRVPIRYKSHLYFEQFEYHPTKELEEHMNPTPVVSTASPAILQTPPPNPNHPLPALRTLPFSSIKIYKNGELAGTAFTDLLAFLPPASKPLNQVGAREGLDDGMLGYFPAVSVFRGGCAEVNFGPDFWFPPPDLTTAAATLIGDDEDVDMVKVDPPTHPASGVKVVIEARNSHLRAVGERYGEQIAEDVVYDLVDEVDFWMQDGGGVETTGLGNTGPTMVTDEAEGAVNIGHSGSRSLSLEGAGEIKELVQEDE